jgi:hypothetical protein
MRSIMKKRTQTGTVMAELAIGCLLTVTMGLFALDLGSAMLCYGINERACRDAARAAAQGTTPAEAENLAKKIVQSFAVAGGLITAPEVTGVNYVDFGGNPPDGTCPFVTVTTRSTARPIAPLSMFGKPVAGGAFPIAKTYTFPIVRLTVKTPT